MVVASAAANAAATRIQARARGLLARHAPPPLQPRDGFAPCAVGEYAYEGAGPVGESLERWCGALRRLVVDKVARRIACRVLARAPVCLDNATTDEPLQHGRLRRKVMVAARHCYRLRRVSEKGRLAGAAAKFAASRLSAVIVVIAGVGALAVAKAV